MFYKGCGAAFVDIGENKNTFIHAQDIIPKIDVTKQERKSVNIKDIAKPGMPILVQVKRDSTHNKGARVSTHISLPGRYIVLMPNVSFITVSQKIEDPNEKERLKKIVTNNLPEGMGAIIRTSSINKNESELLIDIKNLLSQWNSINENIKNDDNYPRLVHLNDSITKKILLDMIDQKIDNILVNSSEIKQEVEQNLKEMQVKNNPKIQIEKNVLNKYDIEKQIEKMDKRKIWLKCGGFITIDKTEALIAIDVNSGKYIGKETLEKTVYIVNKEATEEIAKQLRLRDLEGIIIIDYIDMKSNENREKILEHLKNSLKQDRSKTQVLGFTKLNLLEMTRKHMYSRLD